MSQTSSRAPRPTSPHLQIYKPQMTSALSIFHRFTGVFYLIGLVKAAIILTLVRFAPNAWDAILTVIPTFIWYVLAAPIVSAIIYHLLNGVRHLSWDAGFGLSLPTVYKTGIALLCSVVLFSLLFWL